jgi:hypothetical protein
MSALIFVAFPVLLFCGIVPVRIEPVSVIEIIEWLLVVKLVIVVVMAEVASTASFGMLLVWLLRKEYKHLFGVGS